MCLNKQFLFLLTILLCFSACREDSSIVKGTDRIDPTVQQNIETLIRGYVTDQDGLPISNAIVSVIDEMTETDAQGYFQLKGLVGKNQAVVKVERAGYFNQFKTFIANQETIDQTRIRLIEKTNPQSLNAVDGGEVIISGRTKVDFKANSFIDEAGNDYQGIVKVFSHYIDPTDTQLDMVMPGNLLAFDTEDELNILQSFGMANIELEGANGQRLDIKNPAGLTVEVPLSIAGHAPSDIPLWYFDETSGYWIEEGKAVLENGLYFGEVSHFTFWNCDVPSRLFTLLSGQVINSAGSQMVKVRITNTTTGVSYTDWTDSDGNFDGYVPKGELLLLEVIGHCGDIVIHSESIGAFNTDTANMGLVNISNNLDLVQVDGVLIDCMGLPVSNGQVVINFPDDTYPIVAHTDSDGSFSTVVTVCGATEFTLTASDNDILIFSLPIVYTISPMMDLGLISVCSIPFNESIVFVVDGLTKIIPGCTVNIFLDGARTAYEFEFTDYDTGPGNNPVEYSWKLYDSNNDILNPEWTDNVSHSTSGSVVDSLTVYPNFHKNGDTYQVLQEANLPGEVIALRWDDTRVDVIKHYESQASTLETFLSATVILSAQRQ